MAASGNTVEFPCTMMLQRIPSRSNRDDVVQGIHALGFEGTYDFFYLPLRQPNGKSQNYGYAFINFRDCAQSQRFAALVDAGQLHVRNRSSEIKVVAAELQGIEKLRKHFQHSSVMKGPAAPIFVADTDVPRGLIPDGVQAQASAANLEPLMAGPVPPAGRRLADTKASASPLSASRYSMSTCASGSGASSDADDVSIMDAEDNAMLEEQSTTKSLYTHVDKATCLGELGMPLRISISSVDSLLSNPLRIEIDAERFWGKQHAQAAFVGSPNEPLRVPLPVFSL
eukprot:TRINITY_DN1676_c0_g2_i2.p1 TRINITY_DN1676_c0_g2~~TRINITY_DN1676_c0_g2_i2.p1  ORF type:complete len:284 (+),score=47.27 TRINITY_DN1676_c0_g2_i2:136-987(+)